MFLSRSLDQTIRVVSYYTALTLYVSYYIALTLYVRHPSHPMRPIPSLDFVAMSED